MLKKKASGSLHYCPTAMTPCSGADTPCLLLLLLLLAVGIMPDSARAATTPPVVIGTWSNTGFPDPVIQAGLRAVSDGIRVAVHAANAEGGVNGRPIRLLECEATFNPSRYASCVDEMAGNSTVATLGLVIQSLFNVVKPKLQQYNLFTVPSVGHRYFDRHWVFMRANDHVLLTTMVRHVINDLHFQRVGLVWTLDALDIALVTEAENLCTSLGLTFTGSLGVSPLKSNYLQSSLQEYLNFLAPMPQAILFFGSSVPSAQQVLIDLLNRSTATALSNGYVVPELTIILWDGASQILFTAAKTMTAIGHADAVSRLRLVTGLPHLMDHRYLAAQHAYADFTAYFGNTSFTTFATDYFINGLGFWIQTRFIINVLRQMNPNNLTHDAFIDKVFDSGVFTVDDLTFGMFADECRGFRATTNFFCQCNDAYRTVETYTLARNSFELEPVRNGTVTTSFGECASSTVPIIPPLVYLLVAPSDVTRTSAATSVLSGATSLDPSLYENCSLTPNGLGNATKELATAVANRYVSVIFPAVFATADQSDFSTGDMTVVDPLYFPAKLTPTAFDYKRIHMSATLEQELFALASCTVVNPPIAGIPSVYSAVIRSAEAAAIQTVITASLNTFGAILSRSSFPSVNAPLVMPWELEGYVFVLGISTPGDVTELINFLSRNERAVACVAFNELSVLYDAFTARAKSVSGNIDSRIIFASSFVNWNGNSSAAASGSLLSAYAEAFPDPMSRSPLSLRGFVVNAAVRKVANQISPGIINSSSFAAKWYSISVIVLSSEIVLGAYSQSPCLSAADTSCESNIGARVVRIFALADVMNVTAAAMRASPRASVKFQSGRIEYKPLPVKSEALSTAVLAAIIAGSTTGAIALAVLALWLRESGKRNNSAAPIDQSKPVTIMFTDIESSTSL